MSKQPKRVNILEYTYPDKVQTEYGGVLLSKDILLDIKKQREKYIKAVSKICGIPQWYFTNEGFKHD